MVSSFCQLLSWIFRLLASLVDASSPCYLLQSFDPQYSFIPSKYSSMNMCIWFHSHYEKCTTKWRNYHYIDLLVFLPFRQWMPMGEKSWGFKGIWSYASCFVLKHLPFMLCIMLLCIVEYIEEIPLGFDCQYMQWNSSSLTRAYIMGEFALCIQLVLFSKFLI